MKFGMWAMSACLALGVTGTAMAAPRSIAPGSYHCKAGGSRTMLTLGDIQISGMNYMFKDPNGGSTSGSYAVDGNGYRWSGDIGAITNEQIVESGPDASADAFYFKYKARPTSLPTTASCGK